MNIKTNEFPKQYFLRVSRTVENLPEILWAVQPNVAPLNSKYRSMKSRRLQFFFQSVTLFSSTTVVRMIRITTSLLTKCDIFQYLIGRFISVFDYTGKNSCSCPIKISFKLSNNSDVEFGNEMSDWNTLVHSFSVTTSQIRVAHESSIP